MELIITMAIISVLAVGGTAAYKGFFLNNQLDGAAQKTVAALKNAQNKAISGENNSNWGINIVHATSSDDYYQLYYGTSTSVGTSTATTYYPSSVKVDASYDVNFSRINGSVAQKIVITLYLASDPSAKKIIAIDGSGSVSVVKSQSKWTITPLTSPGEVYGHLSADLGLDGLSRVSYWKGSGSYVLEFLNCLSANCVNRAATTIETLFGTTQNDVVVGQDGFARVAYHYSSGGNMKFAHCTNSNCTSKNITNLEDISGPVGISIAIGLDGFPRIAYSFSSTAYFRFVRCLDADCASKNITEVETDSGWHPSLTIGSDGFARISYYNPNNSDLKFARCLDADCVTKNITAVDTVGSVGRFTSLVLDNNGYGQIVYYDDNSNPPILKFAKCANIDCTSKSIVNIDSALYIFDYDEHPNAIAMGKDGFPRIIYRSGTDGNGAIQFVECLNADCSSKNIESPDAGSSGNGAAYSFLDVDSSGLARIVYLDTTNYTVKLAKQNW